MRSLLKILVILGGLGSALAAETAPVYERAPLPPGPLVRRAPDFSQWQIAFSYEDRATGAVEGATPAAHAKRRKDGAVSSAKLHLPQEVTVTRTKPRWHAVLLFQDGRKMESWGDGPRRFEVGPEPTTVIPIAEFNPGYHPPFLEYSTSDFPDVEWVTPQTYLGTEKDTTLWVFRQAEGGAMAWIDPQTRFPVRWQSGSESRVFKFLPNPTEILTLPANIAKLSEDLQSADGNPAPAASIVPNQTLIGKVMCGYQGWFNAPEDSVGLGWRHFGDTPGRVAFDMWPDMSEYPKRYPTKFKRADGSAAELYSAYDEATVLLHFKWMRDYGLDGIFLQRFASEMKDPRAKKHVDAVLAHVRKGAQQYGRVYGMMYDLTPVKEGGIQSVIEDWKWLVDNTHLTKDERYVRHRGKPLVVLWGLGFGPTRDPLLDDGLKFVEFLKNDPVYGGNAVMIGVPTDWRTADTAEIPLAKMEALVAAADIVSPWLVGGPAKPEEIPAKYARIVRPDVEWCRAHGKDYMPVVFPGFSWYNLRKGTTPSNQIPRQGGRYLWTQYLEARKAGATMVYQAMFDEVDEATAIFKVTNQPPDGAGLSQFVTYEGLPSDFYLKLVGQATRMMRGEFTPENDTLVKDARWVPFVPALPVVAKPPAATPAGGGR